MYLVFVLASFLFINAVIMVLRRGYIGRFYFEFNGIPSILIGVGVGFFSAVVCYGYLIDLISEGNIRTFITVIVTLGIICVVSWFLNYRFFR